MSASSELKDKINEVREELKRNGLWKKNLPVWVTDYEQREINTHEDFTEWLQFIYLPNRLEQTETKDQLPESFVALQAKKYFSEDVRKGKLLQLLIELDSLS